MKKYLSTTRANSLRSSSVRRWYVVGVVVALLLGALTLPALFSFSGRVLLAPVHTVSLWLRESDHVFATYVRDRQSLTDEIAELRTQLDGFAGVELSLRRLVEENIALRAHVGEDTKLRLLTRVVARPPFMPYDLLQLDKGSDDGVEVGAPLFAGRDVVVGTIIHVTPSYSFAELVTSPGFSASVYVTGAHLFATMEGMGSGVARVRYSPNLSMSPGDLVLMPTYDAGIFGVITRVENAPTQSEHYGYVALPDSLQRIRYLTIGPKADAPMSIERAEEVVREQLMSQFLIPGAHDYQSTSTLLHAPATNTPAFITTP